MGFMDVVRHGAPVLSGVLVAVIVLAFDAVGRSTRRPVAAGILGLAASSAACIWSAAGVPRTLFFDVAVLGGAESRLAAFMYALAAIALLGGWRSLVGDARGGAVTALIVFTVPASVLLAASHDLAITVIALEAVALTGYGLVAAGSGYRAYEAAMKYFVQGAIAAGFLVYGFAIAYGSIAGTTTYGAMVPAFAGMVGEGPTMMAVTFVLAAFAFKLGAVPFHAWAPDAYETAPGPAAAVMSTVPKIAAVMAAGLFLGGVANGQQEQWVWAAVACAVASVVVGNLGGVRQTNYRRMLAYSGIAQMGYALSGFTVLDFGYTRVVFFTLTYALAALGAFLVSEAVRETEPDWDGSIQGFAGLGSRRPLLAAATTVLMLSLTGIPLTAGFWGKFFVFGSIATTDWRWVALIGLVGSVVSFAYYGNVIKVMFLDDAKEEDGERTDEESCPSAGPGTLATLTVAAAVLLIGVIPFVTGPEWLFSVFNL